jgi:hypothetical protein
LQAELAITRKVDGADRSPAPTDDVGAAQLLARVELLIERLEARLAGPVIPAAMEFDLAQVPDRSTTSASIVSAATDAVRDPASATKEHLLMPMGVMLQRFGRPDSVASQEHGQASWGWETKDGYTLEAHFSWGRVDWVRGGVPSK